MNRLQSEFKVPLVCFHRFSLRHCLRLTFLLCLCWAMSNSLSHSRLLQFYRVINDQKQHIGQYFAPPWKSAFVIGVRRGQAVGPNVQTGSWFWLRHICVLAWSLNRWATVSKPSELILFLWNFHFAKTPIPSRSTLQQCRCITLMGKKKVTQNTFLTSVADIIYCDGWEYVWLLHWGNHEEIWFWNVTVLWHEW